MSHLKKDYSIVFNKLAKYCYFEVSVAKESRKIFF